MIGSLVVYYGKHLRIQNIIFYSVKEMNYALILLDLNLNPVGYRKAVCRILIFFLVYSTLYVGMAHTVHVPIQTSG